jgi:hypothetical protein
MPRAQLRNDSGPQRILDSPPAISSLMLIVRSSAQRFSQKMGSRRKNGQSDFLWWAVPRKVRIARESRLETTPIDLVGPCISKSNLNPPRDTQITNSFCQLRSGDGHLGCKPVNDRRSFRWGRALDDQIGLTISIKFFSGIWVRKWRIDFERPAMRSCSRRITSTNRFQHSLRDWPKWKLDRPYHIKWLKQEEISIVSLTC